MRAPAGPAPALLAVLCAATLTHAGPLGPLPNVTSTEIIQNEGGCLVGDVVYLSGEEVPGASPCERCRCAGGSVRCGAVRCQPRAGCKALHRPDHCCPIYQCECEQEGRVYGNGEKLVDPRDPCRVCYCQGGEVVCRRIACFVRDDCSPRRVPGRCCPEYDNCPLRGVTTVPGTAGNVSIVAAAPELPLENIRQEITIKEITPVSEIPIVTDVKIKEIIPSPSIEISDYTSSKSPLFAREATTEKSSSSETYFKTETPAIIEIHQAVTTVPTPHTTKLDNNSSTAMVSDDVSPSKVSLSTQDSINSEIYPSNVPALDTTVAPVLTTIAIVTTKAPTMEEEDPTMLDHNPAFPPIPDDLSVIGSNHDDETMPSQVVDVDHVVEGQSDVSHAVSSTTELIRESPTTSLPEIIVTERIQEPTSLVTSASAETTKFRESPMLNLRSAIPTELLNAPSSLPEDINGELDDPMDTPETKIPTVITSESTHIENNSDYPSTVAYTQIKSNNPSNNEPTTIVYPKSSQQTNPRIALLDSTSTIASEEQTIEPLGRTQKVPSHLASSTSSSSVYGYASSTDSTNIAFEEFNTKSKEDPIGTEFQSEVTPTNKIEEQESASSFKTNIETTLLPQMQAVVTSDVPKISSDITSQTELSSLPVETSDQNPQESIREKISVSTSKSLITAAPKVVSTSPEIVTVYREIPTSTENRRFDNVETTEFVLTSFGSSESVTDAVELIKISAETDKNAAIIAEPTKKTNFLNDLDSLIGDFAAIGKHTQKTAAPAVPASEELIPVNAGYKSKNKNYNINSITEVPTKDKKQKIEIEDDESSITDAPPPHDNVEPTTRRPLIDRVPDAGAGNLSANNDIEILTQSYVPTINRKPTKVVMKKNNEKPSIATASVGRITPSESSEMSGTTREVTGDSTVAVASTVTDRAMTSTNTPADVDTRTSARWLSTSEPSRRAGAASEAPAPPPAPHRDTA